jgi:hypothetical protein
MFFWTSALQCRSWIVMTERELLKSFDDVILPQADGKSALSSGWAADTSIDTACAGSAKRVEIMKQISVSKVINFEETFILI